MHETQRTGARSHQERKLIQPELSGTRNRHVEHLQGGRRVTLQDEGNRQRFLGPRKLDERTRRARKL